MANINLLPWREREREERKQKFLITLGIFVVIAAALLGAADRIIVSQINNQKDRNAYLTAQIATLDKEIAEIRLLQEQKRDLAERMAVIQDLQGKRSVIVRLFDELVRTLPDGVFYASLTSDENIISIEGVGESNSRVTALLRSLSDSEWFGVPEFRQVTSEDGRAVGAAGEGTSRSRFQITVPITTPEQETEGDQ